MSTSNAEALPPSPAAARGTWLRRLGLSVRRNSTALIMAVIVTALVLPPVVSVVYSSFSAGQTVWDGPRSLVHYRTILVDSSGFDIIRNTFVFAAGSALLGVFLASLVALLVERTNTPFRRFVYFTVVVAFAVPTIIQAMGWILLMGPHGSFINQSVNATLGGHLPTIDVYTMQGIIFVQATVLFPALFLLIAPAFRAADPALEQAAMIAGASRWMVLRKITLPLALPSLLAATLLGFIVTIESFEVPALLGTPGRINVLSTAIFGRIQAFEPDYGAAAAFSSSLMLLTIGGVLLYQRATGRAYKYATVTGKGYRPEKFHLGRLRWVTALITLFVPLLVLAPLLILLWTSLLPFYTAPSLSQVSNFSTENYHRVLGDDVFMQSLKNSLILGVSSALVVMAITLLVAWTIVRRPSRLSKGLDFLCTLPLVVPGVVLSLAMLRTFINFPITIYGTIWLILLAFVIHYLPYGLRYNHSGMVMLHRELEEAADVSGAGRLRVFVRIVVPLMRPALIAGGLFVFLASIRQLSTVLFLTGLKVNVVASTMFSMWNYGSFTDAATASVIVVVAVLAIAIVVYKVSGLGRGGGITSAFESRRQL